MLYETNPDAEVIYVEPPASPNGPRGVTCGELNIGMNWSAPASNADKADTAIQFLDACLSNCVINLVCYGFEGENWEIADGAPTFNADNMPEDYLADYYSHSHVVLDGGWDEAWGSSMCVWDICRAQRGRRCLP